MKNKDVNSTPSEFFVCCCLLNYVSNGGRLVETRDDETAIVNKAESENSSFFVKANWSIDLPEGNINTPVAEPIKYSPSTAKPDKEH